MATDDIGVGIISFNRHACLRRLLASLEMQTHLDGFDFHLFQDGAKNRFSGRRYATNREIGLSVDAFMRAGGLLRREIHRQPDNVSIGINQFEAVEFLARNYSRFIILENDVVLSPHFLRLARVLYEQTEDRDDIFSFSLGFRRRCGREAMARSVEKTVYARPHWWGECFTAEKWQRIRPHFMEYFALICDIDYTQRDHGAIRDLWARWGWTENPATSQDGGKEAAVWRAGMKRLATVVNRGISIGEAGMHWNAFKFRAMEFHEQLPYIHDGDADLQEFELP